MKNNKVSNKYNLDKEDIEILIEDLKNFKIIPETNKILREKLYLIIAHTAFHNNIDLEYNVHELNNINPTDYNLIKNELIKYNKYKATKYLIEEKFIKKEIKLSLNHIFQNFLNKNKNIDQNNIEIASIKLYDFYSSKDKDDSLELLDDIFHCAIVKNIQIISNINTLNSYEFYKKLLLKNTNNNIQIKYMYKGNQQHSYISSIFFMIIKFRIGTNYKTFLLYLEPDVNLAYSTYIIKNDFLDFFLELLTARFEKSFYDKYTIDFDTNLISHFTFNDYLQEIINDINNLLDNDIGIDEDEIFQKLASLKLRYPRIDLAYKIIKNVLKNIFLVKEIKYKQSLEKIPNTEKVIGVIQKEQILYKINKLYQNISNSKDANVDIFLLRRSIFVNIFGNQKQAICDIFNNLKWSDSNEIINSLNEIYDNEILLDKFLERLFISNLNLLNINDKQEKFTLLVDKYIMKGKKIPLGL